jgi:hypothetical protein
VVLQLILYIARARRQLVLDLDEKSKTEVSERSIDECKNLAW